MRTATRGRIVRLAKFLRLRKRSMMAKMPMMMRRALIRMSPTKKTAMTKWLKKAQTKKATESTRACQSCWRVERRHYFGARLAHQLGDGNDLYPRARSASMSFGQSVDGRLAIAAAVVQQDDGAAHPGLVFIVVDLLEDAVDDLLRGLAGVLVPVVGVDLVADDDVAELLDAVGGRGLVVGVRLLIDGVGRPEVERLHAELGGEQALGEVELQIDAGAGDFADVGMGEGVVADLVAFAVDALHECRYCPAASSPIMKKVPPTWFCLRMSRIFGVQVGSGPSSKVRATSLGW